MKPIIGITTRFDEIEGKKVQKVYSNIIKLIQLCGGIPLLIPIIENVEDITHYLEIFDGFVIPGGFTFSEIDEIVIKWAIEKDKPLLGICAGMQAIGNLHNFGSGKSDQTIEIESFIKHNVPEKEYVHSAMINEGFLLDILKEKKIYVNSRHNCMVTKEDYFVVDAVSEDGVIEAIHLPNNTFILGLQWHPEDLDDENSQKIFQKLISIASKK